MEAVSAVLAAVVVILIIYIAALIRETKRMSSQLERRLLEKTPEPISLETVSGGLNRLAENINLCLQAEENLRLESYREEKRVREMTANISHDLRTPVTAIRGYLQLIEKDSLTDGQMEKLRIAQKHTDELAKLIEYFFEYSSLASGEPELSPKRVNLTNLTASLLAGFVDSFEEKGIDVDFKENSSVFCMADEEMTRRIIHNLIKNCLQHSAGNVAVSLFVEDDKSYISFLNPVLPEAELDAEAIFDRFVTFDKARNKSGGLGLAIVKLLAGQMGGVATAALANGCLEIRVGLPRVS